MEGLLENTQRPELIRQVKIVLNYKNSPWELRRKIRILDEYSEFLKDYIWDLYIEIQSDQFFGQELEELRRNKKLLKIELKATEELLGKTKKVLNGYF